MSKSSKRHSQARNVHFPTFKMRPIAVACSSLMFIAGAAYAAEPVVADEAAMETVVVTGLRHSIETSIAAKKDSSSIVEVVTAEDIGKLPDVSIAENLARLPGLTAQRVDGRAQSISIRGMGPKYGVTLLNNREVVSTGDDRSVEYDQFPSELINSATVYKTPDAALAAVGLAGTVNMKTIRPLDYSERKVNLSVRGEKSSNGKLNSGTDDFGGRVSASYVDQFDDGKVGVALGFAHLDNPGQEKYYKSWGWEVLSAQNSQWCPDAAKQCLVGLQPGTKIPTGFEQGYTSTDRKRDGLMAVVEFKPNENFHSMVDLYYTKFKQESIQSEQQAYTGAWSAASYLSSNTTTPDAISGIMGPMNADAKFLARYNKRKDDTFAIGWNNELKYEKWKFGADLSYSRAKRDEYQGQQVAQVNAANPFNYNINASLTGTSTFTPTINLADPTISQLSTPWGQGSHRASTPKIVDDMKAFRLTAERAFDGVISSVEGGINYSDRSKDVNRGELYYTLNCGANCALQPSMITSGLPNVLAWNYNSALSMFNAPIDANAINLSNMTGRVWNVNEKVTTAFAKVNFDVDMKVPVSGNFGLQEIYTDLHATGRLFDGTNVVTQSKNNSYDYLLPSFNAKFDFGNVISKGLFLRVAAADTMARPNMEFMRYGNTIEMSPVIPNSTSGPATLKGNGGNPELKPWRAEAYDFSLEKYFGKRSYVSGAYFYKKMKDTIYNQTTAHVFDPAQVSAIQALNPNFIMPTGGIGTYTAPANGHGGFVKGTELSASIDGSLFANALPVLDGFGVIASVSNTWSSIQERGSDLYGKPFAFSTPLEGLSGMVKTLTAYYEHKGFSARISERKRSSFTAITRDPFGDPSITIIEPESIVDAQIGYAFETGQFKGLSVLFQVNNLTNEAYRTSRNVSGTSVYQLVPERNNTYGRNFLLGATYKF